MLFLNVKLKLCIVQYFTFFILLLSLMLSKLLQKLNILVFVVKNCINLINKKLFLSSFRSQAKLKFMISAVQIYCGHTTIRSKKWGYNNKPTQPLWLYWGEMEWGHKNIRCLQTSIKQIVIIYYKVKYGMVNFN